MGSQPYSELGLAPDVGEGCGNHQMSCTVLSGLETHNLSGPEMGPEMVGHSWEVLQAQWQQNQLWNFLKLEIRVKVNWRSGS